MDFFENSCLSCYKPLNTEQSECDECHYINIKTEDSDERLLLMYFKYLERKDLNLFSIRRDKLLGDSNFDFDADLQFLDDEETTGNVLYHYISKNYPNLVKTNSFMGLGFQPNTKTVHDKNIEAFKKNVFDPILKKIKETYQKLQVLDIEYNKLKPYIFLSELYTIEAANEKLKFTFAHITDAEFRKNLQQHLKNDALDILNLEENSNRLEVMMVLKEKAYSSNVSHLSNFIYNLETAIGNRQKYETLNHVLPVGEDNRYTQLYANSTYNEKLVQLLSYKTHFSYVNHDEKKNFRNALNIQSMAETIRGLSGQSSEIDPWIYLACEEMAISNPVSFQANEANTVSADFDLSLGLALDGKVPEKYKDKVCEDPKYCHLFRFLEVENQIENEVRDLQIPTDNRLNQFQFDHLKDTLSFFLMEVNKFPNIKLSEQTKKGLYHHFMFDDNQNKGLFDRNSFDTQSLRSTIFRLLIRLADDEELTETVIPQLKEPWASAYDQEHILGLIWKRPSVNLTEKLLQEISKKGDTFLSKFLIKGPTNARQIDDKATFHIEQEALDFIAKSNLDSRVTTRFDLILNVLNEKN